MSWVADRVPGGTILPMVASLPQFQYSTLADFARRSHARHTEPTGADAFDDLTGDCGVRESWESDLWD